MSLSKTIGLISGINEFVHLFQWASSAISSLHSRWRGTQEQELQDEMQCLQSGLQCLRDTLPAMYDLIDRAEWKSHKHCVAELLPKLKDAVYDADDLLDEFTWYELKVAVEGNASQSPFIDFFNDVIQGNFNKVKYIQKRLKILSGQLERMGLCEVTQRFDKSVRPETSSFPNETKIFGRDQELKQVMGLLGVPINMSRPPCRHKKANCAANASTSTTTSNQVSNGSYLPVLPIVGIGGVGKTTLAQHICTHPQVKSQFNLIIWICVSDDFDVKRLTKEAIQSCQKKEVTTDNLDYLQRALSTSVRSKKMLIVLDDLWDDALRENGDCWKKFCAPLTNVLQGSMILVTTRSQKVAKGVHNIMKPLTLNGLDDDVFWNFFKLCVFGFDSSTNDPELERIGQSILPKLKGSPLAAKTLGRLLRMKPETTHWNNILESELWQLKQEETDILPALRLSYMYLPFNLKRCFSFCAVYPKDHKFVKDNLAEIWVAEGFVEPQAYTKIQDVGCQYFEDLVDRSFFQKVCGAYVIHDLMHDMAQLVSEHDCFIIKNMNDFQNVPQNVRHLSILSSRQFDCSNLLSLCKHTKLRTLLCNKPLGNKKVGSMMGSWCRELRRLRVISCSSTKDLPDSIGNLRHLRYLEISRACLFKKLPLALCQLYNLQILYARKCKLESLPIDFSKLTSLQRFESWGFKYHLGFGLNLDAANGQGIGIRLMKDMNHFRGDLTICNVGVLSLDEAAEAELKNKEYLLKLRLNWFSSRSREIEGSPLMPPEHTEIQGSGSSVGSPEHSEIEVLQVLQPPPGVRSLHLQEYPGVSLPGWFQPQNLLRLASPPFQSCDGLKSRSFLGISHGRNLNDICDGKNDIAGIFSSLTSLTIYGCQNISSLEGFLHPAAAPAIREISVQNCTRLVSVPTERFRDFHYLSNLAVNGCPNICSQSLVAPSLSRLMLGSSGNIGDIIECRSVKYIHFFHGCLTSIQPQRWILPSLEKLEIRECEPLTSIGNGQPGHLFNTLPHLGGTISIIPFSSLTSLDIYKCEKLSSIDDLMTVEYLPAIETITVGNCIELLYLPGDRFGSFPCLKDLKLFDCPNLNWQRGLVLPSSLTLLSLSRCGDISAWFPSCLHNLIFLVSLILDGFPSITAIPAHIWSSDLVSVQYLNIKRCPDLVSIGGAKAVAKINTVAIYGCPNLKEAKQIMKRGRMQIS